MIQESVGVALALAGGVLGLIYARPRKNKNARRRIILSVAVVFICGGMFLAWPLFEP